MTLRLANVYGPRQLAKLEGGVVAIFMERLAAGDGVRIFGDGEQTRDFVYVGDVVAAMLAAAARAAASSTSAPASRRASTRSTTPAGGSPAPTRRPSTRRRARATCCAACSTPAARAASSAGRRRDRSSTASPRRGAGRRPAERDAGGARPAGTNQAPMEHSLAPLELRRPWRTTAVVATRVAVLELVAIVALGIALLAEPVAKRVREHAVGPAMPKAAAPPPAPVATKETVLPTLARADTSVLVLNGNGRTGAAGDAAARVDGAGYIVAGTANASSTGYRRSVVMYRPGRRRGRAARARPEDPRRRPARRRAPGRAAGRARRADRRRALASPRCAIAARTSSSTGPDGPYAVEPVRAVEILERRVEVAAGAELEEAELVPRLGVPGWSSTASA